MIDNSSKIYIDIGCSWQGCSCLNASFVQSIIEIDRYALWVLTRCHFEGGSSEFPSSPIRMTRVKKNPNKIKSKLIFNFQMRNRLIIKPEMKQLEITVTSSPYAQ